MFIVVVFVDVIGGDVVVLYFVLVIFVFVGGDSDVIVPFAAAHYFCYFPWC